MSLDRESGPLLTTRICLDFGTAFSKATALCATDAPAREAVRPLAIGAASGADHPLLTPSVMFVDQGRILMGPPALERAKRLADTHRDPLLSFKTILAARDLAPALALKVRLSIDPTNTLRHRDALVLYLAHLDQLIRAAIEVDANVPNALIDAPRRYTSPIWRTRGEADRTMARLFDEAAFVSARLGRLLVEPDGVSIAQAKDALDKGEQTLGIGQLEAGVFEAHAAAAAYGAFVRSPKRFILVIDMGAGTTDIAGFERMGDASEPVLSEITGARQCCALAGDEIDEILVNLLIAKSNARGREAQETVWRTLKLSARKLKRDLFDIGKCAFTESGKKLTLKREELTNAAQFKDFTSALSDTCAASLRAVVERAAHAGADTVAILLAGGGANLSFLTDVAAAAGARAGGGLAVSIERFGEDWYVPSGFDPFLQSAFPQVAISLGGALANLTDEPLRAAETV